MDMDTKSALPLVWVLEALARSTQVPISVLIDLSSKIPKSSEPIFTNTRERVSLRILEYIHSQGPTRTLPSIIKSRIDTSESCVDVLQRVMKNSGSNMKAAAAQMSKWDIQPFLKHKRSSLPECFLKRMKDAILTGNPPHLASLREQSGLPVRNQPGPSAPGEMSDIAEKESLSSECTLSRDYRPGSFSALMLCVKCSQGDNVLVCSNSCHFAVHESCMISGASVNKDGKFYCPYCTNSRARPRKDPLVSPVPANSKYQLPQNLPAKSKISAPTTIVVRPKKDPLVSPVPTNSKYQLPQNLPAKSKISAPTTIVEQRPCKDPITQDGNVEAIVKSAKKHKGNTIYSEKHIPHSMPEPPDKSNVESSIAANANGYREKFSSLEITDKNERLGQEQECDDQGQHEHDETANVNMDELDQDIQINVPNADAEKRESCIASDWHNDEMSDIAEKESFLSSECTLSQDYLPGSFSALMLCVKCSKGENVLVCSNSCDLAVHESCMISGASFNKDGKFYCPFCTYSRALSEYQEVKKKVSAARNELTKFISPESRKETEKQPMSPNYLKQVDVLPKKTDLKSKAICSGKSDCEKAGPSKSGLLSKGKELYSTKGKTCTESKHKQEKNRTSKAICSRKLDCEKAGPSESGLPSKGKEVGPTKGKTCTESKHKQEKKRTRQVTRSPRGVRQRQTSEQTILISQNEKTLNKISEESAEDVEIRSEKGVSCPTETDLHCEHERSPSADSASEDEITDYSRDNSYNPGSSSEKDVRVLKSPEKQSLLRAQRRIHRWTVEEEEKLKEAMEVVCEEQHTTIPWTKILAYGAGTFHEYRTAMHLKDKWRNICKAANKH